MNLIAWPKIVDLLCVTESPAASETSTTSRRARTVLMIRPYPAAGEASTTVFTSTVGVHGPGRPADPASEPTSPGAGRIATGTYHTHGSPQVRDPSVAITGRPRRLPSSSQVLGTETEFPGPVGGERFPAPNLRHRTQLPSTRRQARRDGTSGSTTQ